MIRLRLASIRLSHHFNVIGSHYSKSNPDESYKPGQYIINKLFGYRGVILFSNPVSIQNHDQLINNENETKTVYELYRRIVLISYLVEILCPLR